MSNSKTSRFLGGGTAAAAALALALSFTGAWENGTGKPILKAYRDVGGVWTICNGLTEGVKAGMTVTAEWCEQKELDALLAHEARLLDCAPELRKTPWKTYIAINSFAYNVGTGAACKSTLMKLAKKGDYTGACNQLSKWNKVNGKVVKGLSNRRTNGLPGLMSERDLCLEGVKEGK